MSAYLDDLNLSPGDVVQCVANIANPWVKCGTQYAVEKCSEALFVIRGKDGARYINPSARFKTVKDALGIKVHESQWRDT